MNTLKFDNYEIKEPSFFDYKNLIKRLYGSDTENLSFIFENLLSNLVTGYDNNIPATEKIKILIYIRTLILGNEISLKKDDKDITFDINNILINLNDIKTEYKIKNLTFSLSKNLYIKDFNFEIFENLSSIETEENVHDISNLTHEQKNQIYNSIDNIKISEIYKVLKNGYYNQSVEFFESKINLFNGEFLLFLKGIFEEPIQNIIDLEYTLYKHLNFNTNDLQNLSLPECRIFLNKLIQENKDQSKDEGRSAIFFLKNFSNSNITCVDTWSGSDEHNSDNFESIEKNFDFNTSFYQSKIFCLNTK